MDTKTQILSKFPFSICRFLHLKKDLVFADWFADIPQDKTIYDIVAKVSSIGYVALTSSWLKNNQDGSLIFEEIWKLK